VGRAAVDAGFRVRFFRADLLIEALYRGLADNSVGRVIDGILRRSDLVICDELGCAPRGAGGSCG
jgi:DNA replication protein DnaC